MNEIRQAIGIRTFIVVVTLVVVAVLNIVPSTNNIPDSQALESVQVEEGTDLASLAGQLLDTDRKFRVYAHYAAVAEGRPLLATSEQLSERTLLALAGSRLLITDFDDEIDDDVADGLEDLGFESGPLRADTGPESRRGTYFVIVDPEPLSDRYLLLTNGSDVYIAPEDEVEDLLERPMPS